MFPCFRDGTDQNTIALGLEYYDWMGRRCFEWKLDKTYARVGSAIQRQLFVQPHLRLFEACSHWMFNFDLQSFELVPTPVFIFNVAFG